MKSFIVKVVLFSVIVIGSSMVVLSFSDRSTDPFYVRFTTPKQNNLILGTSKGTQGLQPQVFDSILNLDLFNYSFTNRHSPFGSTYLNSIKKKLNPEVKDGIFIDTIDPWSISSSVKDPNDTTGFRENELMLANNNFVNMNPNFEYLLKNFEGQYHNIFTAEDEAMFLHDNGWLEVSIPMDSARVTKRTQGKIAYYRNDVLPLYSLSSVRLGYLKQTVDYLKLHGKVYIVKLPVFPEMFEIEKELMPDFNEVIDPVVQASDGHLDMTNENHLYQYTDGNHLWKESGRLASAKVAAWIKSEEIYD